MNSLKIPGTRDYEYGHELAYKLTCERLGAIRDIEAQCKKSGASLKLAGSHKIITLDYLNQPYRITLPDIEVSLEKGGEVKIRDKILVLHYFIQAKGTPESGKLISYKEIPGTLNYFATFSKRAIKPLVDNFGAEPSRLLAVAGTIGGANASLGDASVRIAAFSRVPLTLVLWRGDAEFPASGSILFDSTVTDYLTIEDVNVLCETVAWSLVRSQRQR